MFALIVRFELQDVESADAFDRLVAETVLEIRVKEPGTVVYAVHPVENAPLSRMFYELYASREAFEAHESQPHTRRFLGDREQYLRDTRVEFLGSPVGKGV
ncbi:MAG TPA: antibiotic biosynthesis monooxygenase [Pseudonocardiaceae bacterium]|jgi:quinol monooxygenase YgiN